MTMHSNKVIKNSIVPVFDQDLNVKLINEYHSYNKRFKDIGYHSALINITPVDKYLVVRLNGIKMRKHYLDDTIKNVKFNKAMDYALRQTYFVTHRKTPTNAQQIYLGATLTLDEVTFIFNTENNYFKRNIMYTVSSIVSTFTAYFIKIAQRMMINVDATTMFGAFSAKPYIFDSIIDVIDFIGYRAASAINHQINKELLFNGLDSKHLQFKTHFHDLNFYVSKFDEYNIQLPLINKYFSIYYIDKYRPQQLNVSRTCCFDKMIKNMSVNLITQDRRITILNREKRTKFNNDSNFL